MAYFLATLLFILIVTSYFLFDKKITHPSFLLYAGGELVVILSIVMANYYGYSITSPIYLYFTLFYLVLFVCFLLYNTIFRNGKVCCDNRVSPLKSINNRLFFLSLINILFFCIVLFDYVKTIGGFSLVKISEIIDNYRMESNSSGVGISFISNQLVKILRANCYISIYVIIGSITYIKDRLKFSKRIYIFCSLALPYMLIALLLGERYPIGLIFVYSIVLYAFMRKGSDKHKLFGLAKLILISFIAIEMFSLSRLVVGRGGDSSALIYLGKYFGNSVLCFDVWFNSNVITFGAGHGLTTFSGITNLLGDFKLIDSAQYSHLNYFVYFNGPEGYGAIGNVFTSISFYLRDFGVAGIFIFAFLIAFLSSSLYYSKHIYVGKTDLSVLIFCYLSGNLFLESYTAGFLGNLFSLDFVVNLFLFILVLCYLQGYKKTIRFVLFKSARRGEFHERYYFGGR